MKLVCQISISREGLTMLLLRFIANFRE